MPAGLSVINANGVLQIDGTYKNLSLAQKYDVTINTEVPNSAPRVRQAVIQPPAGYPLVAWKSDFLAYGYYMPDGSYHINASIDDMGKSLTVYIFSWPSLTGQGGRGAGLWVYDAQGALVFDSTMKWARVVGATESAASPGVINGLPGGEYAVTTSRLGLSGSWDGPLFPPDVNGNATFAFTSAYRAARSLPDGAAWGPVRGHDRTQYRALATPPPQGYSSPPGEILVLDVTGY